MVRTIAECRLEARNLLHRCFPRASSLPLRIITTISVRYLLPGVGGGELERTTMFSLLYDDKVGKLILQVGSTNVFFSLNTNRTLGDLIGYFLHGKPLTVNDVGGSPMTDIAKQDILNDTLETFETRHIGDIHICAY